MINKQLCNNNNNIRRLAPSMREGGTHSIYGYVSVPSVLLLGSFGPLPLPYHETVSRNLTIYNYYHET